MRAEQELMALLQMQHKICQHLGIDVESAKQESYRFSGATDAGQLASDLEDRLPGNKRINRTERGPVRRNDPPIQGRNGPLFTTSDPKAVPVNFKIRGVQNFVA
jgi:hypothetical protein